MTVCRSFELEVGGRKLVIETGKLAQQADAAITLRYGDTVVLVTACYGKEPREGLDMIPLTIDYEERLYAAGKIPGGFIRREGRPSQEATLASRLTDRSIRPLIPKGWRNEIQVIITVLSVDQQNDPDILAVTGASAALSLSGVPFYGPLSAVRVGYINDQMVLNPTLAQMEDSLFDLVVASTSEKVVMVEAGAKEASGDLVIQAIRFAHESNQQIIRLQQELQAGCGKTKAAFTPVHTNTDVVTAVAPLVVGKMAEAVNYPEKAEREVALTKLKNEILESLKEKYSEDDILSAFEANIKTEVRSRLMKGLRPGGRGLKQIRPLSCEVGLLPRTHGSGLFSRGQTQVLTITTLGSAKMEQQLDGLGLDESKRFIHHYNMPPFSNGEVKRIGTPGRREIGHGALVERALEPMIPGEKEFPYTIRLVSEVLSSSGSTSMGSTCASTLSLMDAGIPIKRPVAGIAMGLVTDDEGRHVILTDIEGSEDNYGDMDFKVAGTSEGITAVQMDTKLKGIGFDVVQETITDAREARMFILDVMNKTISASRPELSRYAPRMYQIKIPQEKIGAVIGPGGKIIRSIIEETKTSIDISDDGTVVIGSSDEPAARRAISIIQDMTREIEIGSVYTGKVTRLMPFGAFVEILPGKEGMVHISELAEYRVANIEDEVKLGDEMTVVVIKNDEGKIGLSRKALFGKTPGERPAESSGGERPFRRPPPRSGGMRSRPPMGRPNGPDRGPRQ